MDPARIEEARREIERRYGPWTGHSIRLAKGVHTMPPWFDTRIRRVLTAVTDVLGSGLEGKRVLDLACLEGQLGIEFAMHGAEVVAIEAREANIAKARFARDVLGLAKLDLELGDVRDLHSERHGLFDVVLCAGILYHLDSGDAADLVAKVASVCRRVAVIDTHVSLDESDRFEWRGHVYSGRYADEHPPSATAEEVASSLWYSVDNRRSFTFTLDSLCNLLRRVGFTSVFECLVPYECYHSLWPVDEGPMIELPDRVMLIALKGGEPRLLTTPHTDSKRQVDRPERSAVGAAAGPLERAGRRLDALLARALKGGSRVAGELTGQTRPSWRAPECGR